MAQQDLPGIQSEVPGAPARPDVAREPASPAITGNPKPPAPAKLLAIGLLAGLLSSMLGVGGGIVMIPLLTMWLRVSFTQAVAASSAAIIVIAGAGVALEEIRSPQNIHWQFALMLALTSVGGVWFGQWLKPRLKERVIALVFAAVLVFSALKVAGVVSLAPEGHALYSDWLSALAWDGAEARALVLKFALVAALGFVGGIAAALLGLGGGIVYVPGLAIFFLAASIHESRATSLAAVVLTSAYATFVQMRAGQMPRGIVGWLVPLGVAGALAGVVVVEFIPDVPMRWVIACAILAAALRMAWPRKPRGRAA